MKNYILGAGFLVLAFYLIWQQGAEQIEYSDQMSKAEKREPTSTIEAIENNTSFSSNTSPASNFDSELSSFAPAVSLGEEKLTDGLSTNLSSVTFSNHTGGIRSVQLHQSDRLNKAYKINHSDEPLLGIAFENESGMLLTDALPKPRGFSFGRKFSK